MMFAKLSPDGTRVGYVVGNNIFVQPADGGPSVQLTRDGDDETINGTFDWVYEEEFGCRDGWRWSPDGKRIAYWQIDTHGVKTVTLVDNTTGKYPVLKTFAYPKTGERNSACRIGVVDAAGGPTAWLKIPGDTRNDYYIPRMEWAGDGSEIVVRRINRLQNAIDVLYADPATCNIRSVMTERDGSWLDVHDDAMCYIHGGDAFTWISERDGWRHLYISARDGSVLRRVTDGAYDVIRVLRIDEKAGRAYFLASPDNPTQAYLYSVPLAGGADPARLSPPDQPGTHAYDISEDGEFAVHTYSAFGVPPRVEIVSLPEHVVVRTITANDSLRAKLDALAPSPGGLIRVEIEDSIELDGWMMKPPGFDPKKQYPLFFYVYGEPAAQAVKDQWDGEKYLWHRMLTQHGYVVACVDNRGTPCPRGRDWRKAAYRRVGTLAAGDQAAAARVLLKRPYLDASRVGVWGWSGGGSATLNLLFRHPDLYHTGMAVAAVPDMRLYDTIYQERYMGLPRDNAGDYEHGSPITHAAGLEGNLLMVHGSGDDNCHIQGMEKLADRLIELNKRFSMMTYPNRSHSINEGESTRRHLYGLLTHFLEGHLPPGPN